MSVQGETTQARPVHVSRHFYRCCDCLGVAATETKLGCVKDKWGYSTDAIEAVCDACGGKVEYIGSSTRHTLRHLTGHEPACDGKCTNAVGPSCDCQCGGANHGSGRVVEVYTDSPIPRLAIPKDASVKADAYRALVDQFKAKWTAKFASVTARKGQEYLNGSEFAWYLQGQQIWARYRGARQNRTHGTRNKKLTALISEVA